MVVFARLRQLGSVQVSQLDRADSLTEDVIGIFDEATVKLAEANTAYALAQEELDDHIVILEDELEQARLDQDSIEFAVQANERRISKMIEFVG